ncbi:MAG TPA: gephyrin-like molybdotransferase Glp [Candidatus Limnocylindria bacterium]|nr:gephyrin-like molybdotransferase Glp [Candidatus Limnocylindria bacterium]
MRSVEEALDAILASARLTGFEMLPLDRCVRRVAAESRIVAAVDVPPFDNSSMDGFALRAADAPGTLRLVGEVAAGSAALPSIEPGTTVRIMTGAPMPPGADAVAPLEVVEEAADGVQVPAVEAGAYVRRVGHDTRAGDVVELPSEPLGPSALAVLASLGIGQLNVRRRPRVAILSTGDELRSPGEVLGPGQIHDANSVALAAAVEEAGGEPLMLPRAPDDAAPIQALIAGAAADADLLVASGGVSVGRHDHVRDVIRQLGSLDFWRIRVQPGKPLAYGHVGEMPVIGLPGNPVSALVTFELFVRPLIRRMLGLSGSGRITLSAVTCERMAKDTERRAYLRVRLSRGADGLEARSAGGQASSQLRPLADANGLLIVPEGEPAAEAGHAYDALILGAIG